MKGNTIDKLEITCCPNTSAVSLNACEQERRSRSQTDERPRNDTGIINSVLPLGLQKMDKIRVIGMMSYYLYLHRF